MSSNKENLDLYLPSLINNHKFSQIFYHQNKLILYDSASSANQSKVSPKAIEILERPKTSASISSKLSNRLIQARSKASIDKFISTQKRIQEQKKKVQSSFYLPKKKHNKNSIVKTEQSKLSTLLTQDQSIKRDHALNSSPCQENHLNPNNLNSLLNNAESLNSQEKLMKEIVQKTQVSERKSVRLSIRQIKSVERNQSCEVINEKGPDLNGLNPLSASQQKAKNVYSLRKSVIMNPKDVQKASKSKLSSFSNFSAKTKSKKAPNKQPEIKQQNSFSDSESQNNALGSIQLFERLFNPICALYGSKDLYQKQQQKSYVQDLQIPSFIGVLPRQCYFSTDTEKRKSYIDNRINQLERKIHEQEDIIKHQNEQINSLAHKKYQSLNESNSLENQQSKCIEAQSTQKQNTISKQIMLSEIQQENDSKQKSISKQIMLSEIQQENDSKQKSISKQIMLPQIRQENDSKKNIKDVQQQKKEQALKQQIESLNVKTVQNQRFLENQSKLTISKMGIEDQRQNFLVRSHQSNFQMTTTSPQLKKIVLTSRMRQKSNLLEIESGFLRRASIVNFMTQQYFSTIKELYWLMINQKENAFLVKKIDEKGNPNLQSLKYIKEFHRNRSQLVENTSIESDSRQNDQRIFVDKEFLHQNIQISHIKQEIHWLYFKPCTQSSIFPSQLKLPQHYIITQSDSPAINSLVSLLNCILNLNPNFIERLFEPTYNNVFSCWLNKNNRFEPVYVDGYFPYNGKLNSAIAWSDQFLWIGVLIKCCAKLYGSYDEVFKLNFDEWSQLILGKTLTRLQKPSYQEIKTWQEEEFQQKVIEYLARYQQKHKSTIIVRNKQSKSLLLITGIKNNKIKLSQIHSQTKRLQISLFEFIVDETYELIFFPESTSSYYQSSEFESYAKGNIVTYQLRIKENKSSVTICTQLGFEDNANSEHNENSGLKKNKKQSHEKRRILIYEIPYSGKKDRKQKNQMVLKYSSDNHPYIRIATNHYGIQTLQMDLPQVKRGDYKVFIECGKIKLNDYFESHSKTINKLLKTEDYGKEKELHKNVNTQDVNKTLKNTFSVVSSQPVGLKGGRSLIVNENSHQNEVIEDEHFVYKQGSTNQKGTDQQNL